MLIAPLIKSKIYKFPIGKIRKAQCLFMSRKQEHAFQSPKDILKVPANMSFFPYMSS